MIMELKIQPHHHTMATIIDYLHIGNQDSTALCQMELIIRQLSLLKPVGFPSIINFLIYIKQLIFYASSICVKFNKK